MSKPSKLAEVLTLAKIQSMADAKTFARGKAYFHDGTVSRLEEYEGGVRASVRGTDRYRVNLAVRENGKLSHECSCPVGDGGVFCKHGVAVALSWLENTGEEVFHREETVPEKPRKKRKTYAEVVREYVATLDPDTLRALLLDAVDRDRALRDRLLLAARAATAPDLPSMKTAVRQATRITRMLDWRDAAAYSQGLMSLAEMLRQRLEGPDAAQVVELSELAIAGAEKSLDQIDDSGGGVMPAILELASIHLEACNLTAPDPVALAERLFNLQKDGVWDTFYRVLPAYTEPLGEAGVQRYRELVERAWGALPVLAPSNRRRYSFDSKRRRLEYAIASLAELDGDVDALIRAYAKDLSSSYRFLMLAQLCAKHDRPDEALAWAERGVEESRDELEPRLLEFCVDAYLRRSEFDKADALAWRRFEIAPSAEAFCVLLKVAAATGRHDETRERALAYLWAMVCKEEGVAKPKIGVWQRSTRTELVRIFLDGKENDAAWEAFVGGLVGTRLWPEMAAIRGETHPHDAIALYHRLLTIAVANGANNSARYDEAVEIVRAIGALRAKLGEQAEFTVELGEIRMTHRAKRSFIKLLATLS